MKNLESHVTSMIELNQENYHSHEMNLRYTGVSQIKTFLECEAKGLAEVQGEYTREYSDALLAGQYYDSLFDGTLDKLLEAQRGRIYDRNGKPYAVIQKAIVAYNRVAQDAEMFRLCSGEQQRIMTGMIQGVPVKIMIDSLLPDMIVDRKLMASFPDAWQDGMCVPWWKAYRYDIQAAIYTEIYEQNTGEQLPFVLAAVSKEKEPDMKLCLFSDYTVQNALGEVVNTIERIRDIKEGLVLPNRCERCDYCRRTRTIQKGDFELV